MEKLKKNEVNLVFDSCSENESFARMVIGAFMVDMDPTMEELADVKTAVSEAVTNCVIHGYNGGEGKIYMNCKKEGTAIQIEIIDYGRGLITSKKQWSLFIPHVLNWSGLEWGLRLWKHLWMG